MKCPHCGGRMESVRTTQASEKFAVVRVRKCQQCGFQARCEEVFTEPVRSRK